MGNIIQTLFSEFGRTILAFAVLLMGLLSNISGRAIHNEMMQWIVWFLYSLAFIQIFYIFIVYSKKLIVSLWVFIQNTKSRYDHFKKITGNFDSLPKKQKDILWELYFQKKLQLNYSVDLKFLLVNNYIVKVQDVAYSEAIYQLNKKVIKFLDKKHNIKIQTFLQNLSDIEKDILNLFYDEELKEIYPSEYSNAIESLTQKRITIDDKNSTKIEISKYAKDHLNIFRRDKMQKSEVEIGEHNILAPRNSGSGATGSR